MTLFHTADPVCIGGTAKKLRCNIDVAPGNEPEATALAALVESAYRDMSERPGAGAL